jgi:hypothetical protein
MKTYFKVFSVILVFLLLSACASLIPLKVGPPRDVSVEITPERIARGEYLANNVTGCMFCHSKLNWDYYGGGLPEPGTKGSGGWHVVESMGLMGGFDLYFSNITPAAIGNWTDGELIRAITEGVNRDGQPLFLIMPYDIYRIMDKEDVYSIVAYIRTLEPVSKPLPRKKIKRLLKYIERTFPRPWEPQSRPDPSNTIAYGKYLATIGECIKCHTPMTKSGKPIKGMHLAGGNEYKLPDGSIVRSSNITPDPETGIGSWERDDFIEVFKEYTSPKALPKAARGQGTTVMPWSFLAQMKEGDLEAIYDYLMSVKPVKNEVERWPATESP